MAVIAGNNAGDHRQSFTKQTRYNVRSTKMRRSRFLGGIVLAASILVSNGLLAQQTITVRVEHDENASSNTHKLLTEMAAEVASASGGKLKLEIHSGASLSGGKIPTMIQNVEAGNVDASWISTAIYSSTEPRLGVLSLPFIFSSIDDLERVRKSSVLANVYADQEKRNLHVVDSWSRPLRQIINTKREVHSPEDIAGLRFRVPEIRLWIDAFKAIKAIPVPMPFSEIPTALQLNMIDGAERPTDYIVAEQWWDLAKYISIVNYSGDAVMVSFNEAFWNKLGPDNQKSLAEIIRRYGDRKYSVDKAAAEEALLTAQKKGMVVTRLAPAEVDAFRGAMKNVWIAHTQEIGGPLIAAVRQVAAGK
jgi:TRAP-type transport system periplasmic protein